MNYTNHYNLPEPLAAAVRRQTYRRKGHISVTELAKPPQMRYLETQNDDRITVDVADEIYLLLGSSVHSVLESAQTDNALQEERLRMKVCGWTVTGKPDLLEDDGTLSDFKITSVFAFLFPDKSDWEAQLNVYRLLYQLHGFDVKRLQIVAILRDWTRSRLLTDDDYPPVPALCRPIPMWSIEETRDWVKERVCLHQSGAEGNYQPCTDEERWMREEKWAVKKKDAKRAIRLFDSEPEAELFAYDEEQNHPGAIAVHEKGKQRALRVFKGKDAKEKAEFYAQKMEYEKGRNVELKVRPGIELEIEHRPGQYRRCEDFCKAAPFCTQWQGQLADLEVA